MEREAANVPDDWNDRSSLQDGYGLAMLRSGHGDNRRALWMMYGRYRGHEHDDIMDIGLDAYRSEILGQMGYPRNWNYWEKLWMTQILARQIPFANMTATAQLFDDAGPVHVTEALARGFTSRVEDGQGFEVDPDNWQRRMLALIDVDDEHFYCLDLYRIFGGRENWWSFHAQEDEGFATSGIKLGQAADRDAGRSRRALRRSGMAAQERNLQRFLRIPGAAFRLSRISITSTAGIRRASWSADWKLKGSDGLHFRLTLADSGGSEAIVCDGKSPAGSSPYEMKWVLLHQTGEAPVKTQVCSLMEFYRGEPLILGVRKLKITPADEAGFSRRWPSSFRSRTATTTCSPRTTASIERTVEGGFVFAGRFGYFSQRKNGESRLALIGGNTPDAQRRRDSRTTARENTGAGSWPWTTGKTGSPSLRLRTDPEDLAGKIVYVTNPARRVALKVESCRRTAKGLELDSRHGQPHRHRPGHRRRRPQHPDRHPFLSGRITGIITAPA